MPCDTRRRQGQSISDRAEEIRRATADLDRALTSKQVKVVIGPQGAVTFQGWEKTREESRVTDACAFRRIMATGTALARAEIARAEQLSGRTVNKQVIGQGAHSHDNGRTWHSHKG